MFKLECISTEEEEELGRGVAVKPNGQSMDQTIVAILASATCSFSYGEVHPGPWLLILL